MKLGFGGRFYAALIVVTLGSISCSSSSSKNLDQPQAVEAAPAPRVDVQTPQASIPADVITPAPKLQVRPKPAPKPAPRQTAAMPPAQPQPAYNPPSIAEPETRPVPVEPEPEPVATFEPAAPVQRRVTIPSGTLIPIRMVDPISSDEDHIGQTFQAVLDGPIMVDGETVIPRRADAYVKIAEVKAAGELTGKPELKVQLDSIVVDGQRYKIDSNVFLREGSSQTMQTAKSAGIGALIGGAIGAITGGKKGAAIGAGVGAGGGVAVEAASKKEQARIESESRIDFRLEGPLEITLK